MSETNRELPAVHPLVPKLVSLLFLFCLLAALEGIARLVTEPTDLDRVLDLMRRDPLLFWRQRAHLSTHFAGTSVKTDQQGLRLPEKAGAPDAPGKGKPLRVLCLGASPTFGWGVEHGQTYSAQLEALLRRGGLNAQVINGGNIGFSSHQGRLLFQQELIALEPDIITVSYVINDVDKYRFYRSNGQPDRALSPQRPWLIAVHNLVDRSRFARLFGKALHVAIGRRGAMVGRPIEIYRPRSVRVPDAHYQDNLRGILTLAASKGIKVILLKMPVNLPLGKPTSEEEARAARDRLNQGSALVKQEQYGRALALLKQAAALDPNLSEALYLCGLCLRRLGRDGEAEQAFEMTMKTEGYRCARDGVRYNGLMARVARKHKTPLVDVVAAFAAHKGGYLFVSAEDDPIHPNAAGHGIIARELHRAVLQIQRDRAPGEGGG